ncbi:hypothetical protein OV079_10250 [Nannocystis pusilla]|uniref:Uncharacterized protein n=1 Tax=Nannocystis pusilla TaxID=889268 RepID=A0A9X3ELM2_9BACT|nr:hypothetical protein [Nannocystis pusilla]MCY1005941.1 hypothetical protein [Nannocystis pusilla]
MQVTPSDPGFGVLACPALAPDGLRLFFGAFDSEGGGQGDPNDGRAGGGSRSATASTPAGTRSRAAPRCGSEAS